MGAGDVMEEKEEERRGTRRGPGLRVHSSGCVWEEDGGWQEGGRRKFWGSGILK